MIVGVLGILTYVYVGPQFTKENRQIDAWIAKNDLNHYGDTQNTAYSNSNPVDSNLPSDRYEYIKKMHPDKPWTK
jgi:hypothetical protein